MSSTLLYIAAVGNQAIVDTVSYENLMPNETYTLKGILMDKATGKPLLIDGKEITAETTFKATAASGTVRTRNNDLFNKAVALSPWVT